MRFYLMWIQMQESKQCFTFKLLPQAGCERREAQPNHKQVMSLEKLSDLYHKQVVSVSGPT